MELLEIYNKGHWAGEKGPLSYAIWKELFPPAVTVDPGLGQPNTKYNNHNEMDGPFTNNFTHDCAMVYDLLSTVFNNTDQYAIIKPYKTKCDGRGAWLAFTNHYLSEDNVGHMAGMAEKQLSTISYKGGSWSWNFDKFAINLSIFKIKQWYAPQYG